MMHRRRELVNNLVKEEDDPGAAQGRRPWHGSVERGDQGVGRAQPVGVHQVPLDFAPKTERIKPQRGAQQQKRKGNR